MQRIPEDLGIYISVLFMAICRGDTPSAKLAYRCLYPLPNSDFLFRDVLCKAALFHFSMLPLEITNITKETAWGIILGMCIAPLDKRALSLSIMEINEEYQSRVAWDFSRWLKQNRSDTKSPQPLQRSLLQEAVKYLDREITIGAEVGGNNNYFSSKAIEYDRVDVISKIDPTYYLGDWSWFRRIVEASLQISFNVPDISNIIDIFEVNRTNKIIQFEQDYWYFAKYSLFGGDRGIDKMEHKWKTLLKPSALRLIATLQNYRLPILMSGLEI